MKSLKENNHIFKANNFFEKLHKVYQEWKEHKSMQKYVKPSHVLFCLLRPGERISREYKTHFYLYIKNTFQYMDWGWGGVGSTGLG